MKNEIELQSVLDFWFEELTAADWFSGGSALDKKIKERFSDLHTTVAAGEYWKHRTTGQSLLAEIIVLDQFSRNMYRGSAEAFAYDGLALALAQQTIAAGLNAELSDDQLMFLYMPFMHSESPVIQEESLILFTSLGKAGSLKQAKIHKAIIDQFGRYPHRNEILGRTSTPEEITYLAANQEDFF